MTLKQETKIGLTFGQIISVLGLLGAIVGVYLSLNIRVAQNEIKINNIGQNATDNSKRIEKLYDQNREDYEKIIDRLDDIRDKLDKKQDK